MIGFIIKRLERKYGEISGSEARGAAGKTAGTVGIICNFLLFVSKLAAGLIAGSVSIVGDAVNNLSDVTASVLTLAGFRLAQKPADKHHPYGHARYEYLTGLVITAFILIIGASIGITSVEKIFKPTAVDVSWLTLIILLASSGVKAWLWAFYGALGKKIGSPTLKAASVDSRNDVITTAGVLLGCALEFLFSWKIDGWIGAAVAMFILYSGYKTGRETISPLLGEQADPELVERIREKVLSYDKVLGLHDLLIHDYGVGKRFASAHLELGADEDMLTCHELIDSIENDILKELNVNIVIHCDPVACDNEEWLEMRELVRKIAEDISEELSIHDFRIVKENDETRLVFDLDVPYERLNECGDFKKEIDGRLMQCGKKCVTVISFDGKA